MSGVLQKKLESSGGLPPSVLQNQAFWMSLETVIANWLNDTLGGEHQLRLQSREVCRGTALNEDLFGAYLFGFSGETPDFIVAASIDNLIAARVAAGKLEQDAESLTEAPQLFLQLLLEKPAMALATGVAAAFGAINEDDGELDAVAFDALDVEGSCLLIYYICDIDGQAIRIGVALKLDRVIAYATSVGDGVASGDAASGPNANSLNEPRVQNSSVQLDVIIDRVPMSVADCVRLEPGSVITLPGTDRAKLTISAKTVDGPVDIATGELGVWKHQRAVRLKTEIEPSFLREVSSS
ncbi:MAG: FliM/FliN family flagellar motor C-terminal domain-containing protein [Pseudomonadota bacterium]